MADEIDPLAAEKKFNEFSGAATLGSTPRPPDPRDNFSVPFSGRSQNPGQYAGQSFC